MTQPMEKVTAKEALACVQKLLFSDQVKLMFFLVQRDASLCETRFFIDWANSTSTRLGKDWLDLKGIIEGKYNDNVSQK